jgi:hypothetical protein
MAESVKDLPADILALIEIRQWDMRTHDGRQRFRELNARSLPSIALDSELVFQSRIPDSDELCTQIRRRHQERNAE